MLEEFIELLAVQLHDEKARVLEFATVNGPVMYIGIPPVSTVEIKMDRCTRNDARFLRDKFTSIAIFA